MSETKKITVSETKFNREFTTSSGFKIYYFDLKDDAENWYQFSTNNKNQTKFLNGNSYEVVVEEKQTSKGVYYAIDYSEQEKANQKANKSSQPAKAGYGYVRSRHEAITIITQSSYESAALLCIKAGKDIITTHTQIAAIAKQFTAYVIDQSGLNSTECKNNVKDFLKAANDKSIIYQKSLKLAIICLDLPKMESELPEKVVLVSTDGMIKLADMILNDINLIVNGF
jgi:hypothetical protein